MALPWSVADAVDVAEQWRRQGRARGVQIWAHGLGVIVRITHLVHRSSIRSIANLVRRSAIWQVAHVIAVRELVLSPAVFLVIARGHSQMAHIGSRSSLLLPVEGRS